MNELQIFKNERFGEIRIKKIDNEFYLVGKDVAEILGYKDTSKAITRHVEEDDRMKCPVVDNIGREQETWIINESGFYSLIISSEMKEAKEFKKWVTKDVLPSIRKHGMYATDELLENPDLLIQVATKLKEEKEKNKQLKLELAYKSEIIEGVTNNIDVYKKQDILNRVVKHKGANYKERWGELYKVYRETHHIDLKARKEGYNKTQIRSKDKCKSVIEYAVKFGHIDNLYNIALKLYETDMNEIIEKIREVA